MARTHQAKAPFRQDARMFFGTRFYRYTCGTCGRRSWWKRPIELMEWATGHDDGCWEWVSTDGADDSSR